MTRPLSVFFCDWECGQVVRERGGGNVCAGLASLEMSRQEWAEAVGEEEEAVGNPKNIRPKIKQ